LACNLAIVGLLIGASLVVPALTSGRPGAKAILIRFPGCCDRRREVLGKVVNERSDGRRQTASRRENEVDDSDLCIPLWQDANQPSGLQFCAANPVR
jgi:hypothetical protein